MKKNSKLNPETSIKFVYGDKTVETKAKFLTDYDWKMAEDTNDYCSAQIGDLEIGIRRIDFGGGSTQLYIGINEECALFKSDKNGIVIQVTYPGNSYANCLQDDSDTDWKLMDAVATFPFFKAYVRKALEQGFEERYGK